MGVFDFAKNASSQSAGDIQESMMNNKLKEKLKEYGLVVKDVHVEFNAGVVTITGEAENQATREKVVLAIGNLPGITRVDDRMTVYKKPEAAPEPEAEFYTVQKGDTLGKIAKQFYGDAMKYPQIFEANKPMLKSPDLIYPGQVLRIPR
jgi:nucleoid-associated protein YgaU